MLLYYIRHGDPIYNPNSLTPLGKKQAEAVAKRLALHGMDKIFSSPSNRALETARPLAELIKKEITEVDFLDEDIAWEYMTATDADGNKRWAMALNEYRRLFVKDEIRALGHRWYDAPEFKESKFKEGVKFFAGKVDEFMLSLGFNHDREQHTYSGRAKLGERIAVFAHEGMGAVFLSSLLDIPYSDFAAHYAMSHTGVTVIEFDENNGEIIPRILQVSNDSHLYREGIPTSYCNGILV